MLKKVIQFQDLDGNPREGEFYFNLSQAELAEMELSHGGGLRQYLDTIVKDNDGKKIIETFKMIIGSAVGVRSDDGVRFIKSDDIRDAFMQSDAYSVLFMELVTNAVSASEFINGIVPSNMSQPTLPFSEVQLPAEKENKTASDYTYAELTAMPALEFQRLVDPRKMIGQPQHVMAAAMHHRINTPE